MLIIDSVLKRLPLRNTYSSVRFASTAALLLLAATIAPDVQAQSSPTQYEASRFLMQATLGADETEINRVVSMGFEAWIDEQLTIAPGLMEPEIDDRIANDLNTYGQHRHHAWWRQVMTSDDLLRQRIAVALSEILVVSEQSIFDEEGMANYHDMLLRNAFGNYRDLLKEVSLHPIMGLYLSHMQNRKADPSINRFPDENFAREIMQLFSIGLFELNLDGTHVLDSEGNSIPTYDNTDITNFARVFTGFAFGGPNNDINDQWAFFWGDWDTDEPMKIWVEEHDTDEKTLLRGTVLPAFANDPGRTPMDDLDDTIDNLFNHPNIAPFIGYRLIQRLVTSNPSPAYVQRVSNVFEDNGSGERGDLGAVVKAILMDSEARVMPGSGSELVGRLREPYLRYVRLMRTFNASSPNGTYQIPEWGAFDDFNQYIFASPTVFNFFLPDFVPLGEMEAAGLVGPEFQILNSTTALRSLNAYRDPLSDYFMNQEGDDRVSLDLSVEYSLSGDVDTLIERVDLLLAYGTLSEETKTTMRTAYESMPNWWDDNEKVRRLIHLAMMSPDFSVFQ